MTQSKSSATTSENHLREMQVLLGDIRRLDAHGIFDVIARRLRQAQKRDLAGKHVYIAGNGGSSNNASHLAAHLCDVGIRATCLTDNQGLSSARANDGEFSTALWNSIPYLDASDTVIAFSCSGTSPNIVHLINEANRVAAFTIGIFGCKGRKKQQKKMNVHVALDSENYGAIEDAHSVIVHILKDLLIDSQ